MTDKRTIAKSNFALAVATHHYWAVVDAQTDLRGWIDEYWSPADDAVALKDPIFFGKVVIQVRKMNGVDCEVEGAGDETPYRLSIGQENKATSLEGFMKKLLPFTASLARTVGLNIYHLKEHSDGVFHLFLGD